VGRGTSVESRNESLISEEDSNLLKAIAEGGTHRLYILLYILGASCRAAKSANFSFATKASF
jgi:hypothetical protein